MTGYKHICFVKNKKKRMAFFWKYNLYMKLKLMKSVLQMIIVL